MDEKSEQITDKDNENNENNANKENTEPNEETKSAKKLPNKMRLTVGLVAGVYLLYLAYGLFENLGNYAGTEKLFFGAFAFAFLAAGGILAAYTVRALAKGEYDKGDLPE